MDFINNNIYNRQELVDFATCLKQSHAFRKDREKYLKVKFDCGCIVNITLKSAYRKAVSDFFLCRICSVKQTFESKTAEDIKQAKQKSLETRNKNYIEKYGSIEEGKKASYNKHQETLHRNYGVDNVFQLDSVKQKIKQTTLERYGVEYASQSAEVKEKIATSKQINDPGYKKQAENLKNTFIEKYGGHPSQLADAKCFPARTKYWLDRLFATGILEKGSNFEYHKLRDDTGSLLFNLKCPVCKAEFQGTLYGHIPACPVCHPYYQTSRAEQELTAFIKQIYFGTVIENDRTLISPKELDIYLPDLSLAIEFDGIYWHADDPEKQVIKTELCESKNTRLLHIFENEWEYKPELVKSVIKSIISKNNRKIYARGCKVKEVSSSEAELFCTDNHIQGYIESTVHLGLYYGNELVQLMTFGKSRFDKSYEWEILCECSKQDLTVIGGKSKLFRYFENLHNPSSVITYCDRRYFTGKSYSYLGMTNLGVTKPSCFYIKNKVCLPQYFCQEQNLRNLLPNFDPNLSGSDNMRFAGYHKIYDCGSYIFVKIYKKNNLKKS